MSRTHCLTNGQQHRPRQESSGKTWITRVYRRVLRPTTNEEWYDKGSGEFQVGQFAGWDESSTAHHFGQFVVGRQRLLPPYCFVSD